MLVQIFYTHSFSCSVLLKPILICLCVRDSVRLLQIQKKNDLELNKILRKEEEKVVLLVS